MKPTEQASEGILWAKYLHALKQEGIPEERVRYYTGWVESFRRFQKSRSPEGLGPEEAQDFLRALSERPRIQLFDHDDLHARPESSGSGRAQSYGCDGPACRCRSCRTGALPATDSWE